MRTPTVNDGNCCLQCLENSSEESLIRQVLGLLQAFEEVNEKLANRAFRPVRGDKVVVELKEAGLYYVAEKYHQQYLAKGGRMGRGQSAEKGCTDKIRCYG